MSSEAAFNRAFKRLFGAPPATWRKQMRRRHGRRLSDPEITGRIADVDHR